MVDAGHVLVALVEQAAADGLAGASLEQHVVGQ